MRLATFIAAASLAALPGLAFAQTTTTTKMAPNASAASTTAKAAGETPAATGAGQYSSESAATSGCSGDTVVWATGGASKTLHPKGDKYYGNTKHGYYACEKTAVAGGFHMAGSHHSKKHKSA